MHRLRNRFPRRVRRSVDGILIVGFLPRAYHVGLSPSRYPEVSSRAQDQPRRDRKRVALRAILTDEVGVTDDARFRILGM